MYRAGRERILRMSASGSAVVLEDRQRLLSRAAYAHTRAIRAEAAPTTRAASRGLDQPVEGTIGLAGSRRCHKLDCGRPTGRPERGGARSAPETTEGLRHPVATPTYEVLHDMPTASVSTSLTRSGHETLS